MHVLTSKSYVFMHFPGVNAWICVIVKQDVTPKDHLCSILPVCILMSRFHLAERLQPGDVFRKGEISEAHSFLEKPQTTDKTYYSLNVFRHMFGAHRLQEMDEGVFLVNVVV